MHVLFGIGMQMLVRVFCRPPQDALLGGTLSEHCKNELKRPAGRVGSVREVPMVTRADCEHAQPIEAPANWDALPSDPGPDHRDAAQMYQYEWKSGRVDDVIMLANNVAIERNVCFVHRSDAP